jgi:hypothetical protein
MRNGGNAAPAASTKRCNSFMRKIFYKLALILVLLLALLTPGRSAEYVTFGDTDDPTAISTDVTLAWDANTEGDIAGYNVYYGRVSGRYLRVETVTAPHVTITVRGRQTVYFAVTAFNTAGLESDLSQEVHYP